mgnify:CR=1 FL=1
MYIRFKGYIQSLAKNVIFYKKTFWFKKVYLRDSQNRLGIGFLADSENPSDHFFLKFPPKFCIWDDFRFWNWDDFRLLVTKNWYNPFKETYWIQCTKECIFGYAKK